MGYNVKYIWEHDFDAKMKKDKEYKKVIESLYPHCDPIQYNTIHLFNIKATGPLYITCYKIQRVFNYV